MKKKFSLFFLFLFLLITGLNIHIRLFPAYFPPLKDQAERTVENKILKEAADQVEEQFPDQGVVRSVAGGLEQKIGE